jgi:uncharacterized membrane protein YvbJ
MRRNSRLLGVPLFRGRHWCKGCGGRSLEGSNDSKQCGINKNRQQEQVLPLLVEKQTDLYLIKKLIRNIP